MQRIDSKVNGNGKNTKKFASHRQNFTRKHKKMIRKFLFIIATLCVVNNVAFGATASSSITSSTATTSNQFVDGSYITTSSGFNCRKLKNTTDYETQIIGYDFMNGIIKCAIIPKKNGVMEIPRTENANSLSTQETFEAYYNKHKSDWLNDLKQVAQDAKDTIMGQTVKLEVEVKKAKPYQAIYQAWQCLMVWMLIALLV